MMAQEISIPVYFSKYEESLEKVVSDITVHQQSRTNRKQESALYELFNKISANGYQITVTGGSHQQNKQSKIPIIQGELIPFKQAITRDDGTTQQQQQISSNKLPSIIISTSLKTFGLTNVSRKFKLIENFN